MNYLWTFLGGMATMYAGLVVWGWRIDRKMRR